MNKFEKEFLGLKKKAHFVTEFKVGEIPEEKITTKTGTIKLKKAQEPHTFEGRTANIMGDSSRVYDEETIQQNCLYKKKVLEILNEPLALCSRHIRNDALIKNTQYEERKLIKKLLGLE